MKASELQDVILTISSAKRKQRMLELLRFTGTQDRGVKVLVNKLKTMQKG